MIVVNIDVEMAKHKMSLTELANILDITLANASILKNGKLKAIKITTLNKLCEIFNCQPSDLFEYRKDYL